MAVVRPTGVYLLDFFCSGIQFYYIFVLSLFYILIYMFKEIMNWHVRGLSCKQNIYVSWSTSEQRVRLARRETGLNNLLTVQRRCFFCWSFMLSLSCICFVMLSCASVSWCLVVTCWERTDLLALVCDVTFPFGILGQVWYLIVLIPDFCPLFYFNLPRFSSVFLCLILLVHRGDL